MSKRIVAETRQTPPPKNVTELDETGFHLKPISRRSCGSCAPSTVKICDTLMQADGIVVLPGGTTCDTVRARGPKYGKKK